MTKIEETLNFSREMTTNLRCGGSSPLGNAALGKTLVLKQKLLFSVT